MSLSERSFCVHLSLLVFALGGCKSATRVDAPNLILINGRVFTGFEKGPFAQAIAIRGNRIAAVGTNEEILSIGRDARRIDVGGRLVIPGINDAHVHFDESPVGVSVDFGSSDPSCVDILDRLGESVRTAPRESLLTGTIGLSAFFDLRCTPSILDRIAPENPVTLWTPTLHAGLLNQAAARQLRIRMSDPPVLGGWFGKDMKALHWDGVVQEYAWFRIFETLPTNRATEKARLKKFLDREAQWGVTSITLIEPKPARRVQMLGEIDPTVRVRLVPAPVTEGTRRLRPEYPAVPSQLSDRVSVSGVKWWLDGSPFERSAAMRAPYADDLTTAGQINFPPEEIRAILREASKQNIQLLFHTVGDRTADVLLSAMEATGGAARWSGRRLRIEHGDGLTPDLVARAQTLGVTVVQNPTHFEGGTVFVHRLGAAREAQERPLRSLLTAGVKLVLASDGAADEPELNPYLNIMLACDYPGKTGESLTREQALSAYTKGAAYAEFAEDQKGTLAPGQLADLAVLSQDIFSVSGGLLPKTESVITMVNGKIVYRNQAFFTR